jgi:D-glycerate 3-kinase
MNSKPSQNEVSSWQRAFLERHNLPLHYLADARKWFTPLVDWLIAHHERAHPYLLLAVNGCQGSGKTTLAHYLADVLVAEHGVATLALSLDDFYLPRDQRKALARNVHPLLQTRGVPGTHEISLLMDTLQALGDPTLYPLAVPRFDKASDERMQPSHWYQVEEPPRVVILEGWCLGARPQSEADLATAVNALEAEEDPGLDWRRYVNEALLDYLPLYELVDCWTMLKAPSFDSVFDWRLEQETKLAQQQPDARGLIDATAMRRFIAHYQRLTESCLQDLPGRADCVLQLTQSREIESVHWRQGGEVA